MDRIILEGRILKIIAVFFFFCKHMELQINIILFSLLCTFHIFYNTFFWGDLDIIYQFYPQIINHPEECPSVFFLIFIVTYLFCCVSFSCEVNHLHIYIYRLCFVFPFHLGHIMQFLLLVLICINVYKFLFIKIIYERKYNFLAIDFQGFVYTISNFSHFSKIDRTTQDKL